MQIKIFKMVKKVYLVTFLLTWSTRRKARMCQIMMRRMNDSYINNNKCNKIMVAIIMGGIDRKTRVETETSDLKADLLIN